jgi:alpha-1,2-mannosyltransferase
MICSWGECATKEGVLSIAIHDRAVLRPTTWEALAWTVWISILLFVSVRCFVLPDAKTVYPIWSSTSRLWWSSEELYSPYRSESVQGGYRYSPTFPILTTPFALFPDALGGVLWRWSCSLLYAGAVLWWLRAVAPARLSREQTAWLFLLLVPLSIQSISNGQANVLEIALLLATVAAVKERRWNWTAVFVGLAFACKLYPVALGLLLMVLYPRQLGWRIPAAILAALVMPFATQHPAYVLDQYQKWYLLLRTDDRDAAVWDQHYRDLWLLICLVKAPIPRLAYVVFQVLSGAALAALCWYRQRASWPEKQSLNSTLALATAWMLLLGPSTESCTFILLAPALAWSCLEFIREPGLTWRRCLLIGSCFFFLVAVLMGAFPSAVRLHALGVHPVATLLYSIYLLTETVGHGAPAPA